MWKKTESEASPQSSTLASTPDPGSSNKEQVIIGPFTLIRGEISGKENLTIHGRVEGKIDLKQHNVTVGKNGRVKADIVGKIISIEGEVEGDVYGEDKIIIRRSGAIHGNITSPRVNLEDSSKFKGSINMDSPPEETSTPGNISPEKKATPEKSAKRIDLHQKVNPTSP